MKRVVALFLIASVALFAAVAPQSDLKVKTSDLRELRPATNIMPELIPIEHNNVRSLDLGMSKAPALAVDSNDVTIVYLEDFEDGAPGWVQFDGTAPAANAEWHLLDFGDGDSLWWLADPTLGGYESHWHVALETPQIVLTAGDSTLSFYLDLNCETPGGEDPPYDGWDGANVQISSDSGATWTVLTPTGVPYNCTSLYSFGNVFGQPAPGWGGVHEGIVEADLGDYIGETVSIRFVFASDNAYDTNSDEDMYGMLVDSIDVAGDALYLGSVDDGLVSYSVNEAQGSYWAIEDRTDSIPSPTHLLRNWISGDTTYARNLEDYFVSPSITLPDEPATLIYCDFEFWADFQDEVGEFPETDYWRLEYSTDGGTTWLGISELDGNNYVYSERIPSWYSFQYAYSSSCDLTPLAGETIKFRFYFRSDEDVPAGQGLMIDDFVVYTQPDLPVPANVSVALNAGNVEVNWDDMDGTYMLPKKWMGLEPADYAYYFYSSGYTFNVTDSTVGNSFGMYYSTDGKDITFTSLDYVFSNANPYGDSVQVVLWGVDSAYHVLYASDPFVPDTVVTEQSIDLTGEDVTWNGDFEVEVFWTSGAIYPRTYGADGLCYIGIPGWGYTNVNYSVPFGATGYGEVTYSGLEYNVYRRIVGESTWSLLNSTPLSTNSFVDDTVDPLVEYEFAVVCVTAGFEGQASDGASVFVLPDDHEERKYDDGSADVIFELGIDTTVVVKITPTEYPAKLTAMRFNALYAGDAYKIKIFKDDDGMPGDSWLLIEPPITAIEGWNTFQVPDVMTTTPGRDGVVLRDGESVWIGVKGGDNSPYTAWLGADTSSFSGMATMQIPGGGWSSIAAYLRGNPMIRGYFDTDIDTTAVPDVVPAKYELAQNYPNPFNPVTTIHFELKNTGMTKVEIFDVTGRHVRTLLNGQVEAGAYDLRFDASALSSGVYFYRLSSGSFTDIKKMSLVK